MSIPKFDFPTLFLDGPGLYKCLCIYTDIYLNMFVCFYMCDGEKEEKRETERENDKEKCKHTSIHINPRTYMYVYRQNVNKFCGNNVVQRQQGQTSNCSRLVFVPFAMQQTPNTIANIIPRFFFLLTLLRPSLILLSSPLLSFS